MTTTPRGSRGMKRSCPFDSAELPRPRPSFIPPTPFDDFVDGSSQWLHTTHARNGSNGIQGVLNTASLVSDPLTSDLPLPEACLPRSVCFGAICDVNVRPLFTPVKNMSTVASHTWAGREVLYFDVVKRDGYYTVRGNGRSDIGIINKRMMKALENLDVLGSVTYQALSESGGFRECIKSRNRKENPLDLSMEINIYGPQSMRDRVGKLLALSRLHLQVPLGISGHTMVDNPHLITFPSLAPKPHPAQLPTTSSTPQDLPNAAAGGLTDLLDGLDQDDNLALGANPQCIEVDGRIDAKLLGHQRKGVKFQLQREATEPTSSLSLWKKADASTSNMIFQHRITKKRTSTPEIDVNGGILADEMGLGKTLTMLATILSTSNQSHIFRDSNDGSYAGSSRKTTSSATLVIAPSALLIDGWVSEVERHIGPGILRMHKYHGSRKLKDKAVLADFDIVFTTYHTLAAEFSRTNSDIHGITWYRVVLDEAHNIRNQRTKFFKAATALSANIRWCLTGTPIQNKLEDVGALVRFLRVSFLDSISDFRRYIMQPIESGEGWGFENFRTLLKSICIRRTKDLLQLPEPKTVEHQLELSPAERLHYLQVGDSYKKAIDDAVCNRKPANAYRSVFQVLLKLRMICNHGTIPVMNATSLDGETDETLALLQDGPATCAYCCEDVATDGAPEDCVADRLQACSHVVCGVCAPQYREDLERLRDGFDMACPLCREPLQESSSPLARISTLGNVQTSFTGEGISTKLSKLLKDVREHRFSDKCIIFSSWKKTLSVTAAMLTEHNIPFVQLDGSLSLLARHQVLSAFQHDTQMSVLLMTLGTGAVGLNLTIATRLHIIEPQWNPSIESQAIGRAVRFGQGKQVTIVRYVAQKTVEQYIQSRQSRKLQLAEIGFESLSEYSDEVKLLKLKEFRKYLDA